MVFSSTNTSLIQSTMLLFQILKKKMTINPKHKGEKMPTTCQTRKGVQKNWSTTMSIVIKLHLHNLVDWCIFTGKTSHKEKKILKKRCVESFILWIYIYIYLYTELFAATKKKLLFHELVSTDLIELTHSNIYDDYTDK